MMAAQHNIRVDSYVDIHSRDKNATKKKKKKKSKCYRKCFFMVITGETYRLRGHAEPAVPLTIDYAVHRKKDDKMIAARFSFYHPPKATYGVPGTVLRTRRMYELPCESV